MLSLLLILIGNEEEIPLITVSQKKKNILFPWCSPYGYELPCRRLPSLEFSKYSRLLVQLAQKKIAVSTTIFSSVFLLQFDDLAISISFLFLKHLEEKFLLVLTLFVDDVKKPWSAFICFNVYLPLIVSSCCSYVNLLKLDLYSLIFVTLLFSHIEFVSSQGLFGLFFCGRFHWLVLFVGYFLSSLHNISKGFIPKIIFFFLSKFPNFFPLRIEFWNQ